MYNIYLKHKNIVAKLKKRLKDGLLYDIFLKISNNLRLFLYNLYDIIKTIISTCNQILIKMKNFIYFLKLLSNCVVIRKMKLYIICIRILAGIEGGQNLLKKFMYVCETNK